MLTGSDACCMGSHDPYPSCSIEDAKQKAEHDRKMKLAEEKKQKVRKEVSTLRKQFCQVLLRNKELPTHLHLSTKDFIMDPEMEETLAQQTRDKVDRMLLIMSYITDIGRVGTQGDVMGEAEELYWDEQVA